MIPNKALNAYRNTEVQSRTPLELVVMLYDGGLRFLDAAREAVLRKDIPARRDALSRLLAIISELQSTLDLEKGGTVALDLDNLYNYLTTRIMDAAMHNEVAPLDEVKRLLTTLRDGWQAIATAPPGAVIAAQQQAPR